MASTFANDNLITFLHYDLSLVANQIEIITFWIMKMNHWAFDIIDLQSLFDKLVQMISSSGLEFYRWLLAKDIITMKINFIFGIMLHRIFLVLRLKDLHLHVFSIPTILIFLIQH